MKLQTSPNRWSCIPTSFAMCFDLPVVQLIKRLGHDGSKIVRPLELEPNRRIGFHVQEMIDLGVIFGYGVLVIESDPVLVGADGTEHEVIGIVSVFKYMTMFPGVILGTINNRRHAAAYDTRTVYDPNGTVYTFDPAVFQVEAYCPVIKL